MRRFSITLSSNSGPFTFAAMGAASKQEDPTGEYYNTHENFEQAVAWVLDQVTYVQKEMEGRVIDGYDERHFNPWRWPTEEG